MVVAVPNVLVLTGTLSVSTRTISDSLFLHEVKQIGQIKLLENKSICLIRIFHTNNMFSAKILLFLFPSAIFF